MKIGGLAAGPSLVPADSRCQGAAPDDRRPRRSHHRTARKEARDPPDRNVIDADGHVLEPLDIREKYIDAGGDRLRTPSTRADNAQEIRTEIHSERLMTLGVR